MLKSVTFISTDESFLVAIKKQYPKTRLPELGVQVEVLQQTLQLHCAEVTHRGGIAYDALITPGNSFGCMTGGFDGAVLECLPYIDLAVKRSIKKYHFGELLVGSALTVRPADEDFVDLLVYAPTMRVPTELPLLTDVPYASTLAALTALNNRGRLLSADEPANEVHILMTGHGTSTGEVQVDLAAAQQLMAIERAVSPTAFEDEDLFRKATNYHRMVLDAGNPLNG